MDKNTQKEPTPFPSRLETEIKEILQKSDRPPSPVIKLSSRARRQRFRAVSRWNRRAQFQASGANLLVLTLVLAVAAAIVAHGSPLLGKFFAYASFGTLVYLVGRSLIRPRDAQRTKRWRGRDIDF